MTTLAPDKNTKFPSVGGQWFQGQWLPGAVLLEASGE